MHKQSMRRQILLLVCKYGLHEKYSSILVLLIKAPCELQTKCPYKTCEPVLFDIEQVQVPLRGQALLDFARKDRVFPLLKMTAYPDSSDTALIAGAFELMLIYRAFIAERNSRRKEMSWTADIDSDVGFLGGFAASLMITHSTAENV